MKLLLRALWPVLLLNLAFAARAQTQVSVNGETPLPVMPKRSADPIQSGASNPQNEMARYQQDLAFRKMIHTLYRKPGKDEIKTLLPGVEELKKYANLLNLPKTGLVRLLKDMNCNDGRTMVAATEPCLKYPFPGNGSSYSFREKSYRIRSLADLFLTGNVLKVAGSLGVGILVNVGDVPLESVSEDTLGARFIFDFVPSKDVVRAREQNEQLKKGLVKDDFRYVKKIEAFENATYLLRYVAYKGIVKRSFGKIVYNELDFDKRKDIIVAFRIVEKDADGNLTLLWRELESKDSPRLENPN